MGSYEGEGPKQFAVGFRGYRRQPVDEYVERLHQWLVDSEARAENAVESATTAVGNRAAEILRAALAAGDTARQEAEALKVTAMENAKAEADRLMADAHRQIEELQQSIETLTVRKANVVSELGRLQKYLAAAASGGAPGGADDGAADDGADDDGRVEAISAAPDTHASRNRPLSKSA